VLQAACSQEPDPNSQPVNPLLEHDDKDIVCKAAEALERMGNPRAVEPLLRALKRLNRFSRVGIFVRSALCCIGDERAAAFLTEEAGPLIDNPYMTVAAVRRLTQLLREAPAKIAEESLLLIADMPPEQTDLVEANEYAPEQLVKVDRSEIVTLAKEELQRRGIST
jgi:HEAT repeat protein